jgi:peptidoglycan/LPS O-acetylase OafA/YrhL
MKNSWIQNVLSLFKNDEKNDEIQIIQTLRGLSALGVMIVHLWSIQEKIIIEPTLKHLSQIGSYGVQVFFLISGFILLYTMQKNKYTIKHYFKFIAKRLVRLEPAYIASIALSLLFTNWLSDSIGINYHKEFQHNYEILLQFFYLVPFVSEADWILGVNWTLAIEFQFYLSIALLSPIFINANISKYTKHLLMLLMLCSGLFVRSQTFYCVWFCFFVTGIALFLYYAKYFNIYDLFFQQLICAVFSYYFFQSENFVLIIFTIPYIVYYFIDSKKMPLQFLGKISYSVYLVHCVIGVVVIKYFVEVIKVTSNFGQLLALLCAMLASVLVSVIYYFIFEKPFQKYAKKIKFT